MSALRVNHGICRIKDKVFCAGGNSLQVVHKCMEIYDTRNDCWTQGPELNQRKLSLTLVSIEDRYIYSVGQINDTVYLCEEDARFLQIEKLDTQAEGASQKGWELIELKCDLIRAIANISIISLNSIEPNRHRLLLFGGTTPTRSIVKQSIVLEIDNSSPNKEFTKKSVRLSESSIIQQNEDYYTQNCLLHVSSLPPKLQ